MNHLDDRDIVILHIKGSGLGVQTLREQMAEEVLGSFPSLDQ
jgi:hypothetical protein